MSLSVIIGWVSGGSGGGQGVPESGLSTGFGQEHTDSRLGPAVDPGEVSSIDHHPLRYDLDGENSFRSVEFGVPVLSNVPVEVECGTVLALVGAAVDEVVVAAPVADRVG